MCSNRPQTLTLFTGGSSKIVPTVTYILLITVDTRGAVTTWTNRTFVDICTGQHSKNKRYADTCRQNSNEVKHEAIRQFVISPITMCQAPLFNLMQTEKHVVWYREKTL